MALFKLGHVVVTKSIDERMKKDLPFGSFVYRSLGRYIQGDWGDLDEEDKTWNDEAVRVGDMILAAYIYPATKETIWIITECDRSTTTILYPEER